MSGEKFGIILETPFRMGDTLNDKNDLDITEEQKVTREIRRQLVFEKANKEYVTFTMKDLGIQRFYTYYTSRNHFLCTYATS